MFHRAETLNAASRTDLRLDRFLRTVALIAVSMLSACSAGGDTAPTITSGPSASLPIERAAPFDAKPVRLSEGLRRYLSLVDRSRYSLASAVSAAAESDSSELSSDDHLSTTLDFGTEAPPSSQLCFATASDAAWVDADRLCPGDWAGFRRDPSNSASSGLRFNSTSPPVELKTLDLGLTPRFDHTRFLAVAASDGPALVAHLRGRVERWGADGRVWASTPLGWGEVLAVADLDGDGGDEVLFSTTGNKVPGRLTVLSFDSGEVLWQLDLGGIAFGIEQDRFALVEGPETGTLTLLFGLTYSPSIWRVDFGAGDDFGSVVWKSEHLDYDSPDKAPVLVDTDADGTAEVIVDSLSALYVLDLRTGAIRSKLTYADPVPSFDGPLMVLDGESTSPLVVSMSDSEYSTQVTGVEFEGGEPRLRWHYEWGLGLPNSSVDVILAQSLIHSADNRDLLAWSVTPVGGTAADSVIELVDARRGVLTDRIIGRRLEGVLRPDGASADVLVADTGHGLETFRLIDDRAALVQSYPTLDIPAWPSTQTWGNGAGLVTAPSLVTATSATSGIDALRVTSDGTLVSVPNWPGDVTGAVHLPGGGALVMTQEGSLSVLDRQFSDTGVSVKLDPESSVAPIVADLDADGHQELIVPFGTSSAALRFTDLRATPSLEPIAGQTAEQSPEGFYVPVVGFDPASARRELVGFEGRGKSVALTGWAATSGRLWSRPIPSDVWEPSLAVAPEDERVYLQQSRAIEAIHLGTGELDWRLDVLGECKRSLSFMESGADTDQILVAQAASRVLFIDTTDGTLLLDEELTAPYGGYSATGVLGPTDRRVFLGGSGGVALLTAGGEVLLDEQVDERKIESIPPVILSDPRGAGGFVIASVSAAGDLRIITPDGTTTRRIDLAYNVNTITGALIDGDAVSDLLVSSADGHLSAVSGSTLETLWTIDLGAPSGPAVVADLDADGQTEIVVVSGNGVLHLLVGRSG